MEGRSEGFCAHAKTFQHPGVWLEGTLTRRTTHEEDHKEDHKEVRRTLEEDHKEDSEDSCVKKEDSQAQKGTPEGFPRGMTPAQKKEDS